MHSFLSIVNDYSRDTLVTYGDTVFHLETLKEFDRIKDDVVVGIDSVWKKRFLGRTKEDITLAETLNIQTYGEVEYTGLIKFSQRL